MRKILGTPKETNKKLTEIINKTQINNFYIKNKKDFRDQILSQILESDDVLDIGKSMRDKFSKINYFLLLQLVSLFHFFSRNQV